MTENAKAKRKRHQIAMKVFNQNKSLMSSALKLKRIGSKKVFENQLGRLEDSKSIHSHNSHPILSQIITTC